MLLNVVEFFNYNDELWYRTGDGSTGKVEETSTEIIDFMIELIEKFGMFFKIYDTAKEFIKDLEDNDGKLRGILNYEKIRYSSSKKKKGDAKNKYSGIIDYLSDSDKKLVVRS